MFVNMQLQCSVSIINLVYTDTEEIDNICVHVVLEILILGEQIIIHTHTHTQAHIHTHTHTHTHTHVHTNHTIHTHTHTHAHIHTHTQAQCVLLFYMLVWLYSTVGKAFSTMHMNNVHRRSIGKQYSFLVSVHEHNN